MIFNATSLTIPPQITDVARILPPKESTFRAFTFRPIEEYRVILLGQDPYPTVGDANGLAFSVYKGQKLPRSLKNIFTELVDDIGCEMPSHGDLTAWAEQGVLLANSSLSVLEGQAGVHAKHWKAFTEEWIRQLGQGSKPLVWVLWGGHAQSYQHLIGSHHKVITSVHPSPLSASRGFFGSKPFSKANQYLKELGYAEIDWSL
jgi:uracil-DNA glycosylase